jgi:hypothetical protein
MMVATQGVVHRKRTKMHRQKDGAWKLTSERVTGYLDGQG